MFFVVVFCLVPEVGVGGYIGSHEKDRGLRQHTINYICTSLHLVFPFPPTLIAVSECDVLWTATCTVLVHLLALLNLGSTFRLQGFIWRSADKVPA